MNASRIVITGASGYVGTQLMKIAPFQNAVWLGRKPIDAKGYVHVSDYDETSMRPHLEGCSAVIHLAAVARERRVSVLHPANVKLTEDIARWTNTISKGARFIFISSDMAAFAPSPYGASKLLAERAISGMNMDAVCLRSSMVAGPASDGKPSSISAMKSAAAKKLVLTPGDGGFTIRPLWIKDMAEVLKKLVDRKGNAADRGVFSMFGDPVTFRGMIELFAKSLGNTPTFIPVPLLAIVAAGKLMAKINPSTKFPLDYFECVLSGAQAPQPPDIFAHLGVSRIAVSELAKLI